MYCVKWKGKNNSSKGQGKYIFSRATAQKICDDQNKEHPELIHWVESEPY